MPEFILIWIRSLVAFIVLLFLTRLMGKKQLSQLTFFDYVVGITIGSIAASMSADQDIKAFNGLNGLLIWALLPILLGFLSLKSYRFRRWTDGKPAVLIENGKIFERNLAKNRITADELMMNLREKSAFKLDDVEFAVLETNGQLSVMKKAAAAPVTPNQLGIPAGEDQDPRIVIFDGNVMNRTLQSSGYSEEWLLGEVMKQGAANFGDVFFAQLTAGGNLFVDLYSDAQKIPKIPQKPQVAAVLKKAGADLNQFAQQTNNPEAKQLYSDQARILDQMTKEIDPYLRGDN